MFLFQMMKQVQATQVNRLTRAINCSMVSRPLRLTVSVMVILVETSNVRIIKNWLFKPL